ncbi:hypothetical protein CBR_g32342 [Chara braunii]|uniref:Reverse transcriptase n=1 Tax=Chara braunii TaxID=69332 RepID=A0A388JNC0_CHABU|nr:hypothetical protein CBR_g32342 [Chara braunii]|eukprot:GBG59330.1 hypothetical protein CBR_g32342 [Chara braunii]
MAAAPIANGPGRVGALMEEVDSGGSALATTEEAAELIPLDQYVSLGYPGLGMIGTIIPAPEQKEMAEWRPSPGEMELGGPTFVTGEIDVLNIIRALDHRIPLPIGHLLSISEQANERMLQHCKANRKRFALARTPNVKAKSPSPEENMAGSSDPIRVGLILKDDHFLRIKPIPWKSTECDIEIWGIPYNAIIDPAAAVLAISLRVVERADGKSSTNDADNSDEDDPEISKLARQCVYYPPPRTIARTMHLTSRNVQRTKAMILGEPLVQISRMVDSLEPPQTLYEGITPLLSRYSDKKHYCDITDLPRSLLTPTKEVRLLRLGAEASSLEPPGRLEAETDKLGIKIATKDVPWQDIFDGITPEGHVAIREEDAQMMATVFSWRSDHSFIFAPPLDVAKPAHTKQIDVRIWDQLFELHVPQYVPDEIHRVIADILTEYRGAISVTDTDIGLLQVIQHEIQTGNHSPIHCKPYRYSLIERKKALARIQEFETCGWIEPATGPWSFPVVLVPKKNGSIRICIDYRKLNEITIKDVYPLPRIDDLLDAIGCAKYFSKFDIRHGFHHILVKDEDRSKTAFVLFEGTWQWVRCPIGICNAPATFQRAMNMTFQNFVNKMRLTQGMINFCVIVYMDDILVYSETYHGHAQHIEWTLGAPRDAGFKIALKKSEFFLSKISFLGYVVTRGGLRPDSRKVAAAFATLKDALATTPILIRPDPSKQFILITDWQREAISTILAQKGNDGREHVIEYASRTIPDERRNDSAPQGECYAAVWGIQHFHPYLYGKKFRLVTDHEPLVALKKLTNYTGMIGRWAVRLQEYEFDIVHRKMERHGNANGLTRLHRPAKDFTKEDRRRANKRARDYRWIEGKLEKRKTDGSGIWMVVPHPFMRYDWVKTAHEETAAHFAIRITESAIDKNEWYWSNIRDDVKYIVANCQVCDADKAPIQPPRSIVPTVVERPFQRVSMDTTDIVVPPGPNSCEYSVLLVFVDHFSKWIEAYPCRTQQAAEIARYVNRFLGMHQDTEEILTDNGAEFRGEVLRNLVLHGVAIRNTAPHMSQSKGLVENANRVIKTALRRNIEARDPRPWPDIVDHILAVHRGTPHESTGLSPFQLRTNSVACVSIPSLLDESTLNRRPTRATAWDKAKRHLELLERSLPRLARKRHTMTELAQGRQVRSYEARNGNARPRPQYKLGDIVQVRKCARQEQVIGARLLTPRGRISVIRQVQRPHLCYDLLRFAAFFSTLAIYTVAEFRFTEEATTRVLAEISAFRRLSPPGISHIAVVVVFTGDITAIPPEIHSDIYRTLRVWAGKVRTAWTDLLCSARRHRRAGARHGPPASLVSKLASGRAPGASSLHAAPMSHRRVSYFDLPSSIPTLWQSARAPTLSYRVKENSAPLLSEEKWDAWWEDYIELAFCLLEIEFRWSEAALFGEGPEHPEDSVELLIIQAWRTAEQGDLLGIMVDDLPLDIVSHSDKQPGTHVLSRTLEPHLVWSTCTEIDEDNCLYPSQALYLEIDVTDLTFWDLIARQNAAQDEEIEGADEEEEEEEPSSEQRDDPDYVPESEAGIVDESSQPRDEEEEEGNKQAESEFEGFEAEVRDAARERAQEHRKRKR